MKMFCPRRIENPLITLIAPDSDAYDVFGKCSYCGSYSVEVFMKMIREGTPLTATDKNYKVYIGDGKFYFQHMENDQTALLEFYAMWKEGQGIGDGSTGKLVFEDNHHFYVFPYVLGIAGKIKIKNSASIGKP